MKVSSVVAAAGLAVATGAQAQLINGAVGTKPYSQYAVQSLATTFGDSNAGGVFTGNGSELDAAYAFDDGAGINLLFAGNLQSNDGSNNRLHIYIDTGDATGTNVLPQNQLDIPGVGGLRFDNGFTANFGFVVGANNGPAFYLNGGNLATGTYGFIGSNNSGQNGGVLGGGSIFPGVLAALNNSNTAGVSSSSGAGGGSVTTGVEIRIPWATLGVQRGTTMRVSAFIASATGFVSNQTLGSLPAGFGNLGFGAGGSSNNSTVNFASYAGDQFFTIPSPGALALLGLGGACIARRRRH